MADMVDAIITPSRRREKITKIQNINKFPLTAHGCSSCANWSLMVQIEGGSSDVNSFCFNLHPRGDCTDHVLTNVKKMT